MCLDPGEGKVPSCGIGVGVQTVMLTTMQNMSEQSQNESKMGSVGGLSTRVDEESTNLHVLRGFENSKKG